VAVLLTAGIGFKHQLDKVGNHDNQQENRPPEID
jgi:hypothetical protein